MTQTELHRWNSKRIPEALLVSEVSLRVSARYQRSRERRKDVSRAQKCVCLAVRLGDSICLSDSGMNEHGKMSTK